MTPAEKFEARYMPEPNSGCWLWTGAVPGLCVCHKCDVRSCVNPAHMFLGTYKDNMQDAARKGRMNWKPGERRNLPVGEKHHQAKLTADQVREIRESSLPGTHFARRFGVSNVTVCRIRRGIIWRAAA